MRLIRMGDRSRYYGIKCHHCHKPIANGRIAAATTIFVDPDGHYNAYERVHGSSMLSVFNRDGKDNHPICVRILYHRRCIEKILANGPMDSKEEMNMFEEYRAKLLETHDPLDVE